MGVNSSSKPWYRTNDGWGLVVAYVAVVLVAAVVSAGAATGLLEAIPVLDASAVTEWAAGLELEQLDDGTSGLRMVPPFVYLASAVGALMWGLRAIVNAGDQSETGDGSSAGDSSASTGDGSASPGSSPPASGRSLLAGEPRELVLRPFAALPLAAGVYLLVDSAGSLPAVVDVTVPSDAISTTAAVLGLFAGLFLHRTYERLGRIADALRDRGDDPEPSATAATRWYRRPRGTALVAVYLVASVGALVATASNAVVGADVAGLPIPVEVYLYALLGVMGRIFTELIRETDVDTETLALRAVRIPLAMLLAGGVYLLLQLPSLPGDLVALPAVVLAFLVGLYEGVGFHYLSVASKRLLPTASGGATGGGPSDGTSSDGASADAESADEDESAGESTTEEPPEAETQG